MITKGTIITVTFFAPVRVDYYFGSLAAIYEVFTPEQIGCKIETLWAANIKEGVPKITKNCVISKHNILRKKQNK